MLTAGRPPTLFNSNMRWSDMDHKIGCPNTEGQPACKDQSNHSFEKHNVSLFVVTKLPGNLTPGHTQRRLSRGVARC
jgi:hypothetical protein